MGKWLKAVLGDLCPRSSVGRMRDTGVSSNNRPGSGLDRIEPPALQSLVGRSFKSSQRCCVKKRSCKPGSRGSNDRHVRIDDRYKLESHWTRDRRTPTMEHLVRCTTCRAAELEESKNLVLVFRIWADATKRFNRRFLSKQGGRSKRSCSSHRTVKQKLATIQFAPPQAFRPGRGPDEFRFQSKRPSQ